MSTHLPDSIWLLAAGPLTYCPPPSLLGPLSGNSHRKYLWFPFPPPSPASSFDWDRMFQETSVPLDRAERLGWNSASKRPIRSRDSHRNASSDWPMAESKYLFENILCCSCTTIGTEMCQQCWQESGVGQGGLNQAAHICQPLSGLAPRLASSRTRGLPTSKFNYHRRTRCGQWPCPSAGMEHATGKLFGYIWPSPYDHVRLTLRSSPPSIVVQPLGLKRRSWRRVGSYVLIPYQRRWFNDDRLGAKRSR